MNSLDFTNEITFEASIRALAKASRDGDSTVRGQPRRRIPLVDRFITLKTIFASLAVKPKATSLIYALPKPEPLQKSESEPCTIADLLVDRNPMVELRWEFCAIGDSLFVGKDPAGKDPNGMEKGNILRLLNPTDPPELKEQLVGLSRLHFSILRTKESYLLRDLSTNGTFLNSSPEKIGERFLASGDMLSAGGVWFFFYRV